MPWKEVRPVEQKVLFIADYLRQLASITDLCAQYGISRKTGYKCRSMGSDSIDLGGVVSEHRYHHYQKNL